MPEPINRITGKAVPLDADDVDTDQIIPAQFLKLVEKKGLGKYLFYRWRYDDSGKLTGSFVLDKPEYSGAKILVAGKNFGIGSSRENAVWALKDFGIDCVIASSFGDIFYTNASKNALVCVRLDDSSVNKLRERAKQGNLILTVDLESQLVSYEKEVFKFEMEPHIRERLVKGLDEVGYTLSLYEDKIREYEQRMPRFLRISR